MPAFRCDSSSPARSSWTSLQHRNLYIVMAKNNITVTSSVHIRRFEFLRRVRGEENPARGEIIAKLSSSDKAIILIRLAIADRD